MKNSYESDSEKIERLEAELSELKEKQKNIHGQNLSFHDFIALLTHKILTPMNSIIGLTNFLKDTHLNKEQEQLINRIQLNGMSLVDIYNEILDFIQLESNDEKENSEEFDLESLMREVIDSFYKTTVSTKNVDVSPYYQEGLSRFYRGNKRRLEQILQLSLGDPDNTPELKKITIKVSETSIEKEDALKFIITFNPSNLENQHIQYLTSDESQSWEKAINTNNSFFKLLFVKKIVNISRGTFTIQKGENVTHLHITMPMDVAEAKQSESFTISIPEFNGLQSLVISENNAYQQDLQKTLERWGIHCFIADSEKAAIEKTIRETHLNFVIIGDHLPDITAKSLARKIKSLPGKSQLPLFLQQNKKSMLFSSELFVDVIQSVDNDTHIFEKILKNISEGKIQKEPYKLDTKLASKVPLDILVVEDDPSNLDLLMMLLKKLGYKADTSRDGVKAVAAVKEKAYDVILLDIQIPKKSGFQVAKQVLRNNKNPDKNKIIAISANTLQSTIDKTMEAGMVDFVAKPISFKKIEETLIKWGFAHKMLTQNNK